MERVSKGGAGVRNMSFMLTKPQVVAGTKTVTRRMGWRWLVEDIARGRKPRLMACEKCMGRKKGEPLVRLREIEVVNAWFEPLFTIEGHGQAECDREGFPNLTPQEFIKFFCQSHAQCSRTTIITRIEFRYPST